jgi:hypothetical protein
MSAVLQSPTLPMFVNMEDLKTYIDSEIQKGIEKAVIPLKAKIAYIEADLIETKELLALSLKRNTQLENAIFEHDSEGEIIRDKDNQPVLNVTRSHEKPTESITSETPIVPNTTLDLKAVEIVSHLEEKVKPRHNNIFMDTKEIFHFLKNEISEDLRLKDIRNPRQAKKDILERAVKLFSDKVFIIKNKSGNKVTGIALKPSVKRRDTYGC